MLITTTALLPLRTCATSFCLAQPPPRATPLSRPAAIAPAITAGIPLVTSITRVTVRAATQAVKHPTAAALPVQTLSMLWLALPWFPLGRVTASAGAPLLLLLLSVGRRACRAAPVIGPPIP